MGGEVVAFPRQPSAETCDGDGPGPLDAFFLPVPDGNPEFDPRMFAERLVDEVDRFSHLRLGEAVVMFVMRAQPKVKAGRQILGYISLPRFQGSLGDLALWLLATACQGHMPDYLMVLDAGFWAEATVMQREALIFHELCHTVHEKDKEGELKFTDDGRPVFGIQGHDLEEFNDVVRRYGAWLPDISNFAKALLEGGAL